MASWIKRDQLDVTCFFITLFNAQHVSDVNTPILRSLQLIWWVISWVVLLWYNACWCYVVVRLGWCGIRMDVLTSETCWASNKVIKKASDIKLVSLYSTIKMMHAPINIRYGECLKFLRFDRYGNNNWALFEQAFSLCNERSHVNIPTIVVWKLCMSKISNMTV